MLRRGLVLLLIMTSVPSSALSSSLVSNKVVCISGAGPCGLFLASLLLKEDPTVQVRIMEKAPQQGVPGKAFGIGLGRRLRIAVGEVEGLRARVESVGAKVARMENLLVASRHDICDQMTRFILDKYPEQCQIYFEEGVESVNVEKQTLVTTRGNEIRYNVLIGADGIHSMVRGNMKNVRITHHYAIDSLWKALVMPPQPNIEPDSFQPVEHSSFRGRILPRHPQGHTIFFFWNSNLKDKAQNNPMGVETVDDLKTAMTEALQRKRKKTLIRRLLGMENQKELSVKDLIFDQEALQQCFELRAGVSHYLRLDRYNDDVVALLGDAAHGMYNLLGQGCACGLENAIVLAKSLCNTGEDHNHDTVETALESYSNHAVRESHAIMDLNLILHVLRSNIFIKLLVLPSTLWKAIRGRTVFRRVDDYNVSYSQVLNENRFVIWLSRQVWKRQRLPPPSKN